jgi:release factor glutamine methyltransferase
MGLKILTIKDINIYLAEELHGLYPASEISAFANIIRTKFNFTKLQMAAYPETMVKPSVGKEIKAICHELKSGKPIQYILGETTFYNCTIKVNGATLIPRPETEELVDLIVKENKGFSGSILDIGTGSGAIAIALAVNMPGCTVTGTDVSEEALLVAAENNKVNSAAVRFICDDIFRTPPGIFADIGIIVSNPPYVRESEKKLMATNVLGFEPHSALFVPDEDPLKYYSAILKLARTSLLKEGKLYLEINEALGLETSLLVTSHGFRETSIIQDLNGKERFVKAIKND